MKNAFEAIPEKGTITIRHFCQDRTACVMISDTGQGISLEKQRLLGTPFFTTKPDGTGMGLAFVFTTIMQHGGTIDVDSDEGRGTTFIIQRIGVVHMELHCEQDMNLDQFLNVNKYEFEQRLFAEADNAKDQSISHNKKDRFGQSIPH